MKRIFVALFIILISALSIYQSSLNQAYAQQRSCRLNPQINIDTNTKLVNLTFTSSDIANGTEIKAKGEGIWIHTPGTFGRFDEKIVSSKFNNGKVTFSNIDGFNTQRTDGNQISWPQGEWKYSLFDKNENLLCNAEGTVKVTKIQSETGNDICHIDFSQNQNRTPTPEDDIKFKVNFFGENANLADNWPRAIILYREGNIISELGATNKQLIDGFTLPNKLDTGSYQIGICTTANCNGKLCTNGGSFSVASKDSGGGKFGCTSNKDCAVNNIDGLDFCLPDGKTGILTCQAYTNDTITNPCQPTDANGHPQAIPNSCKTAIGNIGIQPENFAKSVLILILSLAGGILIIIFIANGFKLLTSQGDPKKIAESREAIIAAIAGLLVIIFSLAILRLITVDILGIPGFS